MFHLYNIFKKLFFIIQIRIVYGERAASILIRLQLICNLIYHLSHLHNNFSRASIHTFLRSAYIQKASIYILHPIFSVPVARVFCVNILHFSFVIIQRLFRPVSLCDGDGPYHQRKKCQSLVYAVRRRRDCRCDGYIVKCVQHGAMTGK